MNLSELLSELKRRRVFRVAAAYAVAAWLVIQIAATTFPYLHVPEWLITAVIVVAVLGFPVALLLGWAFDVTAEGLVRTDGADGEQGAAPVVFRRAGMRYVAAAGGVLGLALMGGAFVLFAGSFGQASVQESEPDRSIAVLPFLNLSAAPENEYFSDGITEDVLSRLSRVSGLRVISRTSIMSYKGSAKRLQEIAQELGVAHVLEGSVRREANRLRIAVQLVDARTDESIWAETYEREASDVFAIQTEIAEQIAQALRVRLTSGERVRLRQAGTANLAAYELYLQARRQLYRGGHGSAREYRALRHSSIALLRQALVLDPDHAAAYSLLARAYLGHEDLSADEQRDSVVSLSQRAIRLAPDLPDGYVALGRAYQFLDHDPLRATEQFRLALQRDPNHLDALLGAARAESAQLRLVEALRLVKHANALSPTDAETWFIAGIYRNLGLWEQAAEWIRREHFGQHPDPMRGHCGFAWLHHQAGDREASARHLRELLAAAPETPYAWECAGRLELFRGNLDAARTHLERYAATVSTSESPALDLAYLALQTDDRERGERLLQQAEQGVRRHWESCNGRCGNIGMARVQALRGRTDEAVRFIERAIETGWIGWYPVPNIPPHPALASLENHPRYRSLMAELRESLDRQREQVLREGL